MWAHQIQITKGKITKDVQNVNGKHSGCLKDKKGEKMKIVPGTTLFDLRDALDMNNDCLKLLMDTLVMNETHTPDGFQVLLSSVSATYGEISKNISSILRQ